MSGVYNVQKPLLLQVKLLFTIRLSFALKMMY